MTGALDGITVVEVGQFVSVPFCGQLMADAGARVIEIEPPGGDSYRRSLQLAPGESRQFAIKNRGKESVALDLGHPDSAGVVARLADAADVVLVNMSPAAVARRGLDFATLSARNPRLVHGMVTGYGTLGPDAGLPGMDVVMQAHSGLVAARGAEADGVPRHSEVQVADYASSLLLLAGVSMALLARDRTGRGQQVDVSLLGAALTMQNNQFSHVEAIDGWRAGFVADELPALRRAGAGRDRINAARAAHQPDKLTLTAHYRVFGTSDGAISVGAGSPPTQERLAALAGLPVELLRTDPDTVRARLVALFATRSSAAWIAELRAAAIPCGEVRTLDEVLSDPHVEAEGLVADVEHPALGRYRGLGATPSDPTRPSPAFAAHTTAVLHGLGFLECGKPTIAALNGWAMGGGCELALACDIRIAAEHARIGLPEAKRGMGANFGVHLLSRIVPRGIAYELLYTGDDLSAADAQRWGLVNRVVPGPELAAEADALARRIAGNAPLTVQRYKAAIGRGGELPLSSALRLSVGPDPYTSRDRVEGVAAFVEKRPPVWEGR